MAVLSSVAGKVAEYLFVTAGGQLGYLFQYNDNIEKLKKQVKKLEDRRDTLKMKIESAERNGENIYPYVRSWIAEANKISAKAERFLEEEGKANKRCLKGWCINLGQRYRFSKEAKKHIKAISDQLQEVGNSANVSYPAPPSRIISPSDVFSSGSLESRNSIKKKIVKALIDDDGVYIIGICGMAGVGKTTLVKEVGEQVIDDKIYDIVVMAVVSQNPNIMRIQGEIADMLGVTTSLPAHSEIARARFLWERIMKKKRILLILDDVWGKIKFDVIGIPLGENHKGCKIVITSRSTNVCDQMNCQKKFVVETLSKDESWVLFKKLAGMGVETFDPIARDVARNVATKCGGLPIAIVTVVGALKGMNQHAWKNVARQLQKSNLTYIIGMERIVFSSLEQSFNYLENVESKSLFLFCSLFPEDYKISVEDLVRYWIGLRWFGDTDEAIEDVRDRVHAIVSTITSYFLFINDGEKYVKVHHVVRAFAITIANDKFMVKTRIGLEKWPNKDTSEDLICISLMANDIRELPCGLKYPNLQTLLLQENKNLVVTSCSFQEMKDLKVLDLAQTHIKTLSDSLSFLTNLRTLRISGCKLGNLSIIEKLNKLEILDLSSSDLIKEIPTSFGQLTNLKLLDLNDCRELALIPYGVISSLVKLEEFHINRFKQWEPESENLESNANLAELQALSRLTILQIYIPNPDLSPKVLSFQNLTNFQLGIGVEPYADRYWDSGYSRIIKLTKTNIPIINDWVKSLLKRTECLILKQIANLESISLVEEEFNELKFLDITECDEIKCLLNTLEWTPNSTFHNLEELHINDIPNMVELCHGQTPSQSFCKLKVLEVTQCNMMLNIVPSHLLQRFQNLKTVRVNDCGSLV